MSLQSSWKFDPICDQHQVCYGTCNSDKFKCDQQLLDSILESCSKSGEDLSECIDTGKLLHEKMTKQEISLASFNNSQKSYCSCSIPKMAQFEWEQYVQSNFKAYLDNFCKLSSDKECRKKGIKILMKEFFPDVKYEKLE